MAERGSSEARAFWSGTITFGLVSVPVDLYAAVRPVRVGLRTLGPDGVPLSRRYECSVDGEELDADDIVRGYRWDDGRYVVVSDEELEALEPRKTRDIELTRFVDRAEIDPRLLERPYVMAPAGSSSKAYHLLTESMEKSGRAGIATFVMRGNEYLAAIYAEDGLLRAATLRFADELRAADDIGLPEVHAATAERRRELEAELEALEAAVLDESLLRDEESAMLLELAETKRAEGRGIVEVPTEVAGGPTSRDNVVDIMSVLKERLGAAPAKERPRSEEELAEASKKELYERARELDIPGRSHMNKGELIEAIRGARA